MSRVVCIGETMAMVTPDPPMPLASAADLVLSQGGAESNVAAWLVALGDDAHWCGRVGNDVLGARVLAELRARGIGVDTVTIEASAHTGVYFKDPGVAATAVWYYRSGSAGSRLDRSDVERALALRPDLVHITGILPALSNTCRDATNYLLRRARDEGIVASFDVNYRPALWPSVESAAAELRKLADQADIVFVGLDEAATLWQVDVDTDVRLVLPSPGTLIVKDGPRVATCFAGVDPVRVPALPVDVVEPVGAGDAFAAGWLHGYLHGLDAVERLRLGHRMAAQALCSPTDLTALPIVAAGSELGTPRTPLVSDPGQDHFDRWFAESKVMVILRGLGKRTRALCERAWQLGVAVVEIPVQSDADLAALAEMASIARDAGHVLGAGTIISPELADSVIEAGAAFTVAPGLNEHVVEACARRGVPHLPGVATPTEVQRALDLGLRWLKLFPAAQLGSGWISALRKPFPSARFVATGGIRPETVAEFLRAGAAAVALGSSFADAEGLALVDASEPSGPPGGPRPAS